MTTTAKAPELIGAPRLHVKLTNTGRDVERLEAYASCNATWRGQPVAVDVIADRYRAGMRGEERLTPWRIYANRAVVGSYGPDATGRTMRTTPDGGTGEHVSDTARRACSAACSPLVAAWLETPAAADELERATVAAVCRELRDARYPDADRDRRTLAQWAHAIPAPRMAELARAVELRAEADALMADR